MGFKFDGKNQNIDLSLGGDNGTGAPSDKPHAAAPKNPDNIPQEPTQKPPRSQQAPQRDVRPQPKQPAPVQAPKKDTAPQYNPSAVQNSPQPLDQPFTPVKGSRQEFTPPVAPQQPKAVPAPAPVHREAPAKPEYKPITEPKYYNPSAPVQERASEAPKNTFRDPYATTNSNKEEVTASRQEKRQEETTYSYSEPEKTFDEIVDDTDDVVETSRVKSPASGYVDDDEVSSSRVESLKKKKKPVVVEPDDDEDDEDEDDSPPEKLGFFAPRPPKNKKAKTNSSKGKTSHTSSNSKNSSSNKTVKSTTGRQSSYSGGRKKVLYVRIAIFILLAIVGIAGVKSIFFAKPFPTPDRIVSVVREDLEITRFPTSKASSFVIDFTKTYLTYTPEISSTDRSAKLKEYASEAVLAGMDMRVANSNNFVQTVNGEPIITGIDAIDDKNAIFTVQVSLSSGTNLELSIPIYYDSAKNAMALSAPVSTLPAVTLAEVPADNHPVEWSSDTEVVKAMESDLSNYLTAWAASNSDVLKRYISTDATLATKTGLANVVTFESLEELKVKINDTKDPTADPTKRDATASVVWKDSKSPNVSYKQFYFLKVVQQEDKRWYIQDISNVITPETK